VYLLNTGPDRLAIPPTLLFDRISGVCFSGLKRTEIQPDQLSQSTANSGEVLRTHRSHEAYCVTLWWRWLFFVLFLVMTDSNETDRGKPKHLGKNLSKCHFVHHKSHMDWPRDRTRASAVGGRRLTAWAMSRPTLSVSAGTHLPSPCLPLWLAQGHIYRYLSSTDIVSFRSPYIFFLLVHTRCWGCLFSRDHIQTHTTVGRTPLDGR
jgi:hypothetical protein